MRKHIVFFDSHCPFCRNQIRKLVKRDSKKIFYYAPLDGKTAKRYLPKQCSRDTLILMENYKTKPRFYFYSRALFRIYSLSGGFQFRFAKFFDPLYKLIARFRHHLYSGRKGETPLRGEHFLD